MPGPEHNNCSGKHAGFLCFAVHSGMPTKGYVEPQHPVQQAVRAAMQDLTGAAHNPDQCGRDGCSIPTYAVSLTALASAFARFGTAEGLPSDRRAAARQIFQAAVAEPWYVDGTGSFTTAALKALCGAALVKTGAEGVFCGAIPSLGLGVALKCEDGSKRGSEAMMAEVLCCLLPDYADSIAHLRTIPIKTRRGREVGIIRPVVGKFEQLNIGVNGDD